MTSTNMRILESQDAFEQVLGRTAATLDGLTLADAFDRMLAFYARTRADEAVLDASGDMLLYEWGTYDWGEGEHFELSLTRQLIDGEAEDENIWQLHLTFRYAPDSTTSALHAGNVWCESPADVAAFSAALRASIPYREAAALVPVERLLYLEQAG